MRNNFYNQGTSIIAHHFFNTDKKTNPVRYNMGVTPQIMQLELPRYKKPSTSEQASGYMGDMANTGNPKGQQEGTRSATDNQKYVIRSLGELVGPLRNGQSGQTLDLRDHNISPEVYMALAKGQAVEVELQQMAPERVNLFTPMLASVMQIFGGMGGGVAYNEDLSQVITGNGGNDKGQLGKAAEFVNKHGSAYSLGLGTGEHIDVVAKFRVLNQEEGRRPAQDVVQPPPYQAPTPRPNQPENPEDAEIPGLTPGSTFIEGRTQQLDANPSQNTQNPPVSITENNNPTTPNNVPIVNVTDGNVTVRRVQQTATPGPIDNGTPLIHEDPRVGDYNYVDPKGNGKTLDQNVHQFLKRYAGQYGPSGEINNLAPMPNNRALAQSSSTLRGMSDNSKTSDNHNWFKQGLRENTYATKAAQDYLALGVQAGIITDQDLKSADTPKELGDVFKKVETSLVEKYHLCDSGNLGAAHITAMEAALIDRSQALNGAATLATIASTQGNDGKGKIDKYSNYLNTLNAKFNNLENIQNPKQRVEARQALTNEVSTWLKSNGFSDKEAIALRDMVPSDLAAAKKVITDSNMSLDKMASGDMSGVAEFATNVETKLQNIANTITSSGYDSPLLPQFQELKQQINTITGGSPQGQGTIDTLKSFAQGSLQGNNTDLGKLSSDLKQINSSGKTLSPENLTQVQSALDDSSTQITSQLRSLGLSDSDIQSISTNNKLDPAKLDNVLKSSNPISQKINSKPELKSNIQNFVDCSREVTSQVSLKEAETNLQGLQKRFNDNPNLVLSDDELNGLKNLGNNQLATAIDELKNANNIRKQNASDSIGNLSVNNATKATILINDLAQGKITLPLSSQNQEILTKAGLTQSDVDSINTGNSQSLTGSLNKIKSSLSNVHNSAELSGKIDAVVNYINNKSSNASGNLDNIRSEMNRFGEDKVVSSTGRTNFNNAINNVEKDLISQIPVELRNTIAPNGHIDLNAFNANKSKLDPSLASNIDKFSQVKQDLSSLLSREISTNVRNEYNLSIGAREYLNPFIQSLEDKGIDTSFLMKTDSTTGQKVIDYKKALDFANALQSVDANNPPQGPFKNQLENVISKDTDKSLVNSAKNINQKFTEFQLGNSQDVEAQQVLNKSLQNPRPTAAQSAILARNSYMAGSEVSSTESASYVRITPETMSVPAVKNMVNDSFSIGVRAGIITQAEVDAATTDTAKAALFDTLEDRLNAKYNPGLGNRTLTTDNLYGAAHITNLQRAINDSAQAIVSGSQAVDHLFDGKPRTTEGDQKIQDLIARYNASGATPQISNNIDELKNNRNAGVELLKFAERELTTLSSSISPALSEYGQLAELKSDITKSIGQAGTGSGISAVRALLEKPATTPSPQPTQPNPGNAKEYQEGLRNSLTQLKTSLANGVTEVNIDRDGDGKKEVVKITDYLKDLENNYSTFLLTSSEDERKALGPDGVKDMANLFSEVHFDAGLAIGNNVYSEVNAGLALALEASNIDPDDIFGSRGGKTTVGDSKDLTNRLIESISPPKLSQKLDDCFDNDTGTVDQAKLLNLLNLKYTNFDQEKAIKYLGVVERILKASGSVNPVPNLTLDFQNRMKANPAPDVNSVLESLLGKDGGVLGQLIGNTENESAPQAQMRMSSDVRTAPELLPQEEINANDPSSPPSSNTPSRPDNTAAPRPPVSPAPTGSTQTSTTVGGTNTSQTQTPPPKVDDPIVVTPASDDLSLNLGPRTEAEPVRLTYANYARDGFGSGNGTSIA